MIKGVITCLVLTSGLCFAEPIFQYQSELVRRLSPQTPTVAAVKLDTQVYTVFLKNSDPVSLKTALCTMFPDQKIAFDARTRALAVDTDKATIKKIQSVIHSLDRPSRQIKIEVHILELSYLNMDQYKNLFSDLAQGFKVNYDFSQNKILPASNLSATLMRLTQTGQAKVVAKPNIAALDGQKATIKVGDRVPYVTSTVYDRTALNQVTFIDTGIALEISARVTSGDTIMAQIGSKISAVKLWTEFGGNKYPVLSSREAETNVELKNNETLIIAGLFNEEIKSNKTEVPILSGIPLLGELFKGESKEKMQSDIVFMITPQIL